jgi:hypothetical protein
MRHEFEFKQLLRAYRAGIIGEAVFEEEMAKLDDAGARAESRGGGFHAFGRSYESERDAIASFLDKVRAGEASGGEAFAAWASLCKTERLRTGIRMIAEREACHARIFGQRLLDLGGEPCASPAKETNQWHELLSNPNIADNEKLLRLVKSAGSPKEAVRPIHQFIALIKQDAETREALRLFADDELSSMTWLCEWSAALNPPSHEDSGRTGTDPGAANPKRP